MRTATKLVGESEFNRNEFFSRLHTGLLTSRQIEAMWSLYNSGRAQVLTGPRLSTLYFNIVSAGRFQYDSFTTQDVWMGKLLGYRNSHWFSASDDANRHAHAVILWLHGNWDFLATLRKPRPGR